jgi:hypothetical protein
LKKLKKTIFLELRIYNVRKEEKLQKEIYSKAFYKEYLRKTSD